MMVDGKIIDDWEAAFNRLRVAQAHLKSQIGQASEKVAQRYHDQALDNYVKATEEMPDA